MNSWYLGLQLRLMVPVITTGTNSVSSSLSSPPTPPPTARIQESGRGYFNQTRGDARVRGRNWGGSWCRLVFDATSGAVSAVKLEGASATG